MGGGTATTVASGAQLVDMDALSDVSDSRDSEHDNKGLKLGKVPMQCSGNQGTPSPISLTDLPPTGNCRSPRVHPAPRRRRSTGSAVYLGPRSARHSSETDVTDARIARWMK